MQLHRINRAWALTTTLALVASAACGSHASPASSTPVQPTEMPTAERGPFLWQVRKGQATSHVLGTIHTGVSIHELPGIVVATFDACNTLVVETDTAALNSPALMAALMLPPGQSLETMLGKDNWARLVEHLGHVVPPPALARFQPWLISVMLAYENPQTMSQEPSMDSELVARARGQNKELVFLEEPLEQAEMLARTIDVHDLKETLADVPGARLNLKAMVRSYRSGNLAAMAGLTLDPVEIAREPEDIELLLHARNRTWMDTLVPLLGRGQVCVAVGAGHFVGDQGLLALLGRAGFTIERLGVSTTPASTPTY